MSSQKGNQARSRPQKYQNRHAFKNNLHDTSHKTKFINSIYVSNVCERCKQIIEWKIKYKKYKPLKAPTKCVKCDQKTVKHAYHTICTPCAQEKHVCSKCGAEAKLVDPRPTLQEQVKLDAELQAMLKALPERKKRTFIRYMNRNGKPDEVKCDSGDSENDNGDKTEAAQGDCEEVSRTHRTREDLFEKLKSLKLSINDKDTNDFDSDFDYGDLDSEQED
ncbi:uncharacterized protein LOC105687390 [Athalia rosae]|uniref:uncharacterized protein LOC105687390 n=1 Tax=Athalia rosae TaxID=37344 RepID=UPI0020341FCF|nr:uncharacterized protein LOC105687390 [Athalia rosae]